jgi:hypothetical protein
MTMHYASFSEQREIKVPVSHRPDADLPGDLPFITSIS